MPKNKEESKVESAITPLDKIEEEKKIDKSAPAQRGSPLEKKVSQTQLKSLLKT